MADTKEIIKCPACGKEMKKVFIKDYNFNLDICVDGCGGILFDNREFYKFDEQHENIKEIEETLNGKEFIKADESKTRICPVCKANMVKNYASSLKEVEIDECYSCGAKFLDGGELQKIRAQFKTEQERSAKFNKDFCDEINVDPNEEPYKLKENMPFESSIVMKALKKTGLI